MSNHFYILSLIMSIYAFRFIINQFCNLLYSIYWFNIGHFTLKYCEHGNEPSGSIKYGEFLDQLSVLLASSEGLCSMELVQLVG
jgi:hypothetical protein